MIRSASLGRQLRCAVVSAAASLAVAGCSWFGGEEKEERQPAELVEFEPTLQLRELWSASVGDGNETLRLALTPASDGNALFAADNDGRVAAFDGRSGKRLWREDTELPLAGGPSVGSGGVVVGSSDGWVVALDAASGRQRWRTDVASEVLAPPAVGTGKAFVRTVDGKLIALALEDGKQSWFAQQTMPRLSVRGTGAPVVDGDLIICGFDNGRVAAYSAADGIVAWDVLVAPPSGRSEVQRLSDLNSSLQVVGNEVYAVAFQGRLAALARESGQAIWSVEFSSYAGLAADIGNVYAAGDSGVIVAVERQNGTELWRVDSLAWRDLTAPTAFGSSVVAGDFEGYLHFFQSATGTPQARVRAGSARITSAPLVVGETLYVLTDAGKLVAYREVPRKPG
ncbi:MAG: outer membrane protein assembly factor BamB [Gammaproteobacteria bacterium]|nr:outer membrane protein assembly factor BamB [Gammaproteobacteria bacterium]